MKREREMKERLEREEEELNRREEEELQTTEVRAKKKRNSGIEIDWIPKIALSKALLDKKV